MKRTAQAVWKGTGMEGSGILNSKSGVLNQTPYSFKTRFKNEEGKDGTNPEELIAAAHAGCFNMALSFQLVKAGFTADTLDTTATVNMAQVDGGFKIIGIELELTATVPDISKEKFDELATNAKKNCPISQALAAVPVTLSSTLK